MNLRRQAKRMRTHRLLAILTASRRYVPENTSDGWFLAEIMDVEIARLESRVKKWAKELMP